VDLNRNCPTANWAATSEKPQHYPGHAPASEPETRALIRLIERLQPTLIVTLHAPLACVNYDGPAASSAAQLAAAIGLPVRAEIGYPTPGSLGTWAGVERGIPIVTVEFGEVAPETAWEQSGPALIQLLALGR
jgi:protein MpaA